MQFRHQDPPEELIIFTRYPEPGKVKTRLIPHLGEEEAALVHRRLTERIIQQVLPIRQMRRVLISLLYTGGSLQQMKNWLQYEIRFEKQPEGNIGLRMAAAFQSAWSRSSRRAVVIGSDCPAVNAKIVALAFERLLTHDIVLGPAYDGGYYLIGLHRQLPHEKLHILFQNIAWGTGMVFQHTVRRAEQEKLTIATLEKLHDVDRVDDLEHFSHNPYPQ